MPASRKSACFLTAALCVSLAAGCGERQEETSAPGTFAMAAATVPAGASSAPAASAAPIESGSPSAPPAAAASSPSPQPNAADSVEGTKAAAGTSLKAGAKPSGPSTPSVQQAADAKPSLAPSASPFSSPTVKPGASVGIPSNEIKWTEFFDDELQNNPSEKFWNMNGKTVTIKGYMGEVLSFEKHWFLIIPSPGAECPFDNGDETFWNTIMIAFTSSGEKLRFTAGPLMITGRLDVGIKIDESGYKTMFRLYDAKFEKLKE